MHAMFNGKFEHINFICDDHHLQEHARFAPAGVADPVMLRELDQKEVGPLKLELSREQLRNEAVLEAAFEPTASER